MRIKRAGSEDDILFRRGLLKEDYAVLRRSMYELEHPPKDYIKMFLKKPPIALVGKLLQAGIDLEDFYLPDNDDSDDSKGSSPRWFSLRRLNISKEDLKTGLPAMYPLKEVKPAPSFTSTSVSMLTESSSSMELTTSEKSAKRERESSPEAESEDLDEPSTSTQAKDKEKKLITKLKERLFKKKK